MTEQPEPPGPWSRFLWAGAFVGWILCGMTVWAFGAVVVLLGNAMAGPRAGADFTLYYLFWGVLVLLFAAWLIGAWALYRKARHA